MNNDFLKEAQKLSKQVKKNLDRLLELNEQALNMLPDDMNKHRAQINNDVKGILKAGKKGDLTELQNYLNKYADSNNK